MSETRLLCGFSVFLLLASLCIVTITVLGLLTGQISIVQPGNADEALDPLVTCYSNFFLYSFVSMTILALMWYPARPYTLEPMIRLVVYLIL